MLNAAILVLVPVVFLIVLFFTFHFLTFRPRKELNNEEKPVESNPTKIDIKFSKTRLEKKSRATLRKVHGRKPWRGCYKIAGPRRTEIIYGMWQRANAAQHTLLHVCN
jgi:hypothetical protein